MSASNDGLVRELCAAGDITSPNVEAAFRAVDRTHFVPAEAQELAYRNHPLPIGSGQTISQPATVAIMLELLQVEVGMRVLEVGAGSGYVAALLSMLVGQGGKVVALERLPELVEQAKSNLAHYHLPQLTVLEGDGSLGYAPAAPYQRIIVSAASAELPAALKEQLALAGRLVAPVGGYPQDLVSLVRTSDGWFEKKLPGFVFVPLVPGKR